MANSPLSLNSSWGGWTQGELQDVIRALKAINPQVLTYKLTSFSTDSEVCPVGKVRICWSRYWKLNGRNLLSSSPRPPVEIPIVCLSSPLPCCLFRGGLPYLLWLNLALTRFFWSLCHILGSDICLHVLADMRIFRNLNISHLSQEHWEVWSQFWVFWFYSPPCTPCAEPTCGLSIFLQVPWSNTVPWGHHNGKWLKIMGKNQAGERRDPQEWRQPERGTQRKQIAFKVQPDFLFPVCGNSLCWHSSKVQGVSPQKVWGCLDGSGWEPPLWSCQLLWGPGSPGLWPGSRARALPCCQKLIFPHSSLGKCSLPNIGILPVRITNYRALAAAETNTRNTQCLQGIGLQGQTFAFRGTRFPALSH